MRSLVFIAMSLSCICYLTNCKPTPKSVIYEDNDDNSSGGDYAALHSSIAALKSLYKGGSQRIGETVYIVGSITANDIFGEYGDRLIVEDDSGAIEICVDLEGDLSAYGIGTLITLYCSDLWLGGYGGTIVLGGEPSSDSVVETLSADEFGRKLLSANYDNEPRTPTSLTIDEITTRHISCYIMLSGLLFSDIEGDGSFCTYDDELGRRVTTTHLMCDADGRQISLYVPSTVIYADESLPNGSLQLYGILSSYGGNYSITLVERRIYEL